jgi:diguanylate cyclase (GGDEF)-like protein
MAARSVYFRIPAAILVLPLLFTGLAEAQQYSFRVYGLDQGLNNLAVKGLHQDNKGFLWVSTENGIFRYDGERFQSFGVKEGIPPSSGVAFGEAPDGSLLAGGEIGLFREVGERFEPVSVPGAKSVSWFSGIRSDGNGSTWVATDAGLMVMTRELGASRFAFRLVPKPASVEKPNAYGLLVEDHTVWYGCDKQLCQFRGGQVTVFGAKAGLPPSQWKGIQRAGNGDLWAQGRSEVAVLRRGSTRFEIPESPFRSSGTTGVLSVDSAGRVIFGTNDGLIIRENDRWKSVGRNSGLRGSVYCALQDREGSLWIGLLGRGLVRWVGYQEWEAFTSDSGLDSDIVYEMLPLPDGTVWAATEAGLFHGVRVHDVWTWRRQPQLSRIPIHSIRPDRAGRFWLGTESKGAARFNPVTGQIEWFTEKQGLSAKNPYTLTLDGRNRIWAATERGLFVADLSALQFRPVEQVPRIQMWATIEAANGDIWVGSAKGLFRLSGGTWSHFTASDGLSHEVILSLAAAKNGDVWVGYRYGGGLDRIRMNGGTPEISRPANNPGGRPATVYFLGFDSRERLWAGTDRGVDVWDGSAWNHYDRQDGLVWDDCDLNGFAAAPDGSVWFGTSGGLARFTQQQVASRIYAPDVIYTKVILGNKEVDPAAHPSVDHASNVLHTRFSALTFARESSVLFRYRMAPLFDGWRETQQRELQFDGLPPGTYRLELLARDGWGRWSAVPAAFSFQVRAPWWRGRWVLPILLIVPLAVVVLLSRLRGAAMRRRESNLIRLVEDRTAELKQANQHLLRLSSMDGLTGIANRRTFDQTLEREWNQMLRTGAPLSLVLLDIDYFKLLNDELGHLHGDESLILLASELQGVSKRKTDLVARFGGEEFAMILPATDRQGAAEMAENTRLSVARLGIRHPRSPIGTNVTVSLGLATATPGSFPNASELVAAADKALYLAKHRGRDRVACFDTREKCGFAAENVTSKVLLRSRKCN